MKGDEVLQQTNGHNYPEDGVQAKVERVKYGLHKQAQEEATLIPSIYNDVLVDLATILVENEDVASKLPTFPSLKSSL